MLGEQAMYRTLTSNVRYIVWPLTRGNAKIYLSTIKLTAKAAMQPESLRPPLKPKTS